MPGRSLRVSPVDPYEFRRSILTGFAGRSLRVSPVRPYTRSTSLTRSGPQRTSAHHTQCHDSRCRREQGSSDACMPPFTRLISVETAGTALPSLSPQTVASPRAITARDVFRSRSMVAAVSSSAKTVDLIFWVSILPANRPLVRVASPGAWPPLGGAPKSTCQKQKGACARVRSWGLVGNWDCADVCSLPSTCAACC